jgi:hypothetical protein
MVTLYFKDCEIIVAFTNLNQTDDDVNKIKDLLETCKKRSPGVKILAAINRYPLSGTSDQDDQKAMEIEKQLEQL